MTIDWSSVEYDWPGIARIEKFLDVIESLDNEELFGNNLAKKKIVESNSQAGSVENLEMKEENLRCFYTGEVDKNNLPWGEGKINYEDLGSFHGFFHGSLGNRTGSRYYVSGDILKIMGTWKGGILDGYCRTDMVSGEFTEGIYCEGKRSALFRSFGVDGNLTEFAQYKDGRRHGWVYFGTIGGGYLIGEVDKSGELSGNDIAYVYPDFRTAIRGKYENGVLVSGYECRVISSKVENGITYPVYSECGDIEYTYEPATDTKICLHPLLQDPWEKEMIEVKESSMEQGGQGLFARTDLPEKTVIALFAGVKVKWEVYEKMETSDYSIRLNADYILDIPQECIQLESYRATLGHKANHSFKPNGEFSLFEHPRFGTIRAISAKEDIKAGEEILVNYSLELNTAPDWYKLLWIRHLEEDKKWTREEILRYIERNYDMTCKRIQLPVKETLEVPEPRGIVLSKCENEAEPFADNSKKCN